MKHPASAALKSIKKQGTSLSPLKLAMAVRSVLSTHSVSYTHLDVYKRQVSDSAITHQSAIIEMIVKEKGAEICRDTAQIVVLEDEAAVQSLTIKDPGVIKVGDTVKLKAEVEPESVDTSGLYFKVKKINDYAEVSADGTLKAYKAGTFTVQAILDGVIAERIITCLLYTSRFLGSLKMILKKI